MNTNDLSKREMQMIITALSLVSPCGGGSEQYTLCRKLSAASGIEADAELLTEFFAAASEQIDE